MRVILGAPMRACFVLLVLLLPGCGGDDRGIVGTWVVDMDATELSIDPHTLAGVTVAVKRNGTYVRRDDGRVTERGEWQLEGATLSVVPTERNGEMINPIALFFSPPRRGTYDGDRITFAPDGTPHSISATLVLKRR